MKVVDNAPEMLELPKRSWLNLNLLRYESGRVLLLLGFILIFGLIDLTSQPPLWWDEGWTLALARNWVETGHYGQLLLGEPAPPGLAGSFEVVAPIALIFRLLGVGVWQGRLIGVLYTLGSFFFMFILARKLFNQKIAWASILVLLFLLPHPMVNPLLVGRQVLGDIPVVFYLLAGYLLLLAAWSRSLWFLLGTCLFWGVALKTKGQTLPFLAAAVLVPLSVAVLKRNWRTASLLTLTALGSWSAFQLLVRGQTLLLRGRTLPQPELPGYYQIIAFVPDLGIRSAALQFALIVALPVLLGLGYAGWKMLRDYKTKDFTNGGELVSLSMLAISGSWVLWYLLFSNGGDRYLATPSFLSAVFVAVFIADFTAQFDLLETVNRAAAFIRLKEINLSGVKALTAILISIVFTGMTLVVFYLSARAADDSAAQLAMDINGQTSADAVIESYDSELFFFLDRPYHFPPDQLHIPFLRRYLLDLRLPVAYDPLTADPDYLVIGPLSANWRVYDDQMVAENFRLLRSYSRYQLYERVR